MAPVPGFTRTAIANWTRDDLNPDYVLLSNGLACFTEVINADCQHQVISTGGRKPKTCLNLVGLIPCWVFSKTSLGGA
jgi:hypothetical protein